MNTSPPDNPSISGGTMLRLALHVLGPEVDPEQARAAASRLEPHLPAPSVWEHLEINPDKLPKVSLFQKQARGIQEFPAALFTSDDSLLTNALPEQWIPALQHHCGRLRKGREFELFEAKCSGVLHDRLPGGDIVPESALVAGMLLFLFAPAPGSPLRRNLMRVALSEPIGAYLSAEALLVPEEREAVLRALRSDSRLVYWASQLPGLAKPCAQLARTHRDLWAAMTIASAGETETLAACLRQVSLAALEEPAAASAALVLQPRAKAEVRKLWLNTLKQPGAARYAYETARWMAHALQPGEGSELGRLRDELRPYVADHGRWQCHWFRDVQPNLAPAIIGEPSMDPVWCVELIAALDQAGGAVDDYALRFRMAEQADTASVGWETLILDWLNRRLASRREGREHGTVAGH